MKDYTDTMFVVVSVYGSRTESNLNMLWANMNPGYKVFIRNNDGCEVLFGIETNQLDIEIMKIRNYKGSWLHLSDSEKKGIGVATRNHIVNYFESGRWLFDL